MAMHTELLIFDLQLQLQGEVSSYTMFEIERNYDKLSTVNLTLPCDAETYQLLTPGRIIVEADKPEWGYIIENVIYTETKGPMLEIHAYSLNYMLAWRYIIGQQIFEGLFDHVVKQFISSNAITTDTKRIIPNLVLSSYSIPDAETIKSSKLGGKVLDHVFEVCNEHDATVDVIINHDEQNFEVVVWRGIDRSEQQSINDRVMFSKELDNVLSQKYINLRTDYKTTAIIRGEEWYDEGHIVERINDEVAGFERREVFIESSLTSEFTDEEGYYNLLDEADYREILRKEALDALKNSYYMTESMEFEISTSSEFVLDQHYTVGDIVSLRNDNLGLIMHARVMQARKVVTKAGTRLAVKFGTNTQSVIEKLVKKVK